VVTAPAPLTPGRRRGSVPDGLEDGDVAVTAGRRGAASIVVLLSQWVEACTPGVVPP